MTDKMYSFAVAQVPEMDVLKAAEEIQKRRMEPKVEPGVYRWNHTTDVDPFFNNSAVRRKNADGSWHYAKSWGRWEPTNIPRFDAELDESIRNSILVPLRPVEGVEYEGGDGCRRRCGHIWEVLHDDGTWVPSFDGDEFWRTGQLRPVAESKPWRPKEEEWVQHKTKPWHKARMTNSMFSGLVFVTESGCLHSYVIDELRPATDEEIEAAKRIELKDRLIVRKKSDGSVWQYNTRSGWWSRFDVSASTNKLVNLTLDHYDILDTYTIQGAK